MSTTAITGTAGNDTLLGGFGNDSISALGGDDSVDGQAGSDTIDGGDGRDTLIGNYGDDVLLGGLGDDFLSDDQGSNVLDGGEGFDSLETRSLAGNYSLRGGAGDDNLQATGKTLSLDGGDGNDSLDVRGELNGSYVSAGVATLLGGAGNDSLNVGYFSQASLDGGAGNDSLSAFYSRAVSMTGGTGEDRLTIEYYNSYSNETDGSRQKPESYVLDGGDDNDVLNANGSGFYNSGQVFITMRGGAGADSLTLTDNNAGKQSSGSAQYGVSGALIEGGEGNDSLSASGVLQATLSGGAGVDRFMLTGQQWYTLKAGHLSVNTETGYVTVQAKPVEITDFVVGATGDVLDYSDLLRNASLTYNGSNPFSSGFLKLTQQGADTLLQFDEDGSTVTTATLQTLAVLKNVQASQLIAANFNPNFPPDGSPPVSQPITGTSGNDTLLGGFGNDSISALGGNDSVDGQAGSDTIDGGDGSDTLIGGAALDVAIYSGRASDYQISWEQASESYIVSSNQQGSDTLLGIERIAFKDFDVEVGPLGSWLGPQLISARTQSGDPLLAWRSDMTSGKGNVLIFKNDLSVPETIAVEFESAVSTHNTWSMFSRADLTDAFWVSQISVPKFGSDPVYPEFIQSLSIGDGLDLGTDTENPFSDRLELLLKLQPVDLLEFEEVVDVKVHNLDADKVLITWLIRNQANSQLELRGAFAPSPSPNLSVSAYDSILSDVSRFSFNLSSGSTPLIGADEVAISAMNGGSFFASWTTPGLHPSDTDVVGRFFSPSGEPFSEPFALGNSLPAMQSFPASISLDTGSVVAFWLEHGKDKSTIFQQTLTIGTSSGITSPVAELDSKVTLLDQPAAVLVDGSPKLYWLQSSEDSVEVELVSASFTDTNYSYRQVITNLSPEEIWFGYTERDWIELVSVAMNEVSKQLEQAFTLDTSNSIITVSNGTSTDYSGSYSIPGNTEILELRIKGSGLSYVQGKLDENDADYVVNEYSVKVFDDPGSSKPLTEFSLSGSFKVVNGDFEEVHISAVDFYIGDNLRAKLVGFIDLKQAKLYSDRFEIQLDLTDVAIRSDELSDVKASVLLSDYSLDLITQNVLGGKIQEVGLVVDHHEGSFDYLIANGLDLNILISNPASGLLGNGGTLFDTSNGVLIRSDQDRPNNAGVVAGSMGSDLLFGLDGDDRLISNGGKDTLDGGTGLDTAVLVGSINEYVDRWNATNLTLELQRGTAESILLKDIETLQFADRSLSIRQMLLRNREGSETVYRFYDPDRELHLFVRLGSEFEFLFQDQLNVFKTGEAVAYRYEGIAFGSSGEGDIANYRPTTFGSDNKTAISIPVRRLYNPADNAHFYSLNNAELSSKLSAGWIDDGTAFYAFPDIPGYLPVNSGGSTALTGTATSLLEPIYRYTNKQSGDYVYLREQEASGAKAFKDLSFESLAFWVPKDLGTNQTIQGGSGNDTLDALGGNDFVVGGKGNDQIGGGLGSDSLYGEFGSDRLEGYLGADWLDGGSDNDTISGGGGNDVISGGAGIDVALFSGTFNDYSFSHIIDRGNSLPVPLISDKTISRDGIDWLYGIEQIRFSDQTIAISNQEPRIKLKSSKSELNTGDTCVIEFELSDHSVDFTLDDVTVVGGTLSTFSGSGSKYTATFTADFSSTSTASISVSSNRFTNLFGVSNRDGTDSDNSLSLQYARIYSIAEDSTFSLQLPPGTQLSDMWSAYFVDPQDNANTLAFVFYPTLTTDGVLTLEPSKNFTGLLKGSTSVGTISIYVTPVNDPVELVTSKPGQFVGWPSMGYTRKIVQQDDGKVVYVGSPFAVNSAQLFRLTSDGILDINFGQTGITNAQNLGVGQGFYTFDAAVQPDNKVVAGGSNSQAALIRVDTDGSSDNAFGLNGEVLLPWELGSRVHAVEIDPSGGIVAAGRARLISNDASNFNFAVARILPNGSLDASFDGDGIQTIDLGGFDVARGLAFEPNGKIVVAGYSNANGSNDIQLTRLHSNGQIDSSFGIFGISRLSIPDNEEYAYGGILRLSDGKYLVTGSSMTSNPEGSQTSKGLVVKFNTNGTIDKAFGSEGVLYIDFPNLPAPRSLIAYDASQRADGKIYIPGYITYGDDYEVSSFVTLINLNGSLDPSFGLDGSVISPTGSTVGTLVDSDSRFIMGGSLANNDDNPSALLNTKIRLLPTGEIDTTFNATPIYLPNGSPIRLTHLVSIYDPDADPNLIGPNANYGGITIVLQRESSPSPYDRFGSFGRMQFVDQDPGLRDAGLVMLASTEIGTYSQDSGRLELSFNQTASQALVDEAIASLSYANASNSMESLVRLRVTARDAVLESTRIIELAAPSIVYHWKSHVLLDDVVLAAGSNNLVEANDGFLDLRHTTFNPISNILSTEIWIDSGINNTSSVDLSAFTSGALSVKFTPSVTAEGWTFESNTFDANTLRLGGFVSNAAIAPETTPIHIGTIEWQFQPDQNISIKLKNIEVGTVNSFDHAIQIERHQPTQDGWLMINPISSSNDAIFAAKAVNDGSFNGGVTSADALAALRLAVGLNPNEDPDGTGPLNPAIASPYQYLAADVTGDETVTSIDALTILKMAVGLKTVNPPYWMFIDERADFWDETLNRFKFDRMSVPSESSEAISYASQQQANLVGVVMGDVNGSWNLIGGSTVETMNPDYFQDLATVTGTPIEQWGLLTDN